MLKVFNCTGITPKRKWNGNQFFGIHRKDVVEVIKMADFKNKNDIKSRDTGIMVDNKVDHRYTSVWAGLVSRISKQMYVLPGFESVHNVKLNDNSSVPLHCKVVQDDGEPLFTCVTTE